jgi:DNA-binding HxlR family transcriptional regulator/putative sterol carrier protein
VSRRSYQQYCATARTLDLVGERWTLLVVRELLTGPRRFGDLLGALPGMGTGLLAARLRFLQDEGLVRAVTLPPPARTAAYALTEAGAELGPAVLALARWGMTWALGNRGPDETFRPGWAVLGMQAVFDPDAAADLRAVYEFRVDDEVFHARVHDGTVESVHGAAQQPDVVVTTDSDTFIELVEGRRTVADAVRDGTAALTGDRRLARRLRGLFRRPQPRERGADAPAVG